MRITRGWILCLWLFSLSGWAQDSDLSVTVDAEFIELRSGPARAYPVFHISKRGERLIVLARRTNWFRVETSDGIHGWISNEGIAMTRDEKGQALTFENGSFDAYRQRQFEVSVSAGVLEKSPAWSFSGTWVWNENIWSDLSYSQALGDFSENQLLLLGLHHSAWGDWRIQPHWGLYAGRLRTTPRANLVQEGAEQRDTDVVGVGLGMRYYLARKFVLELEYSHLLALTDRESNEELQKWKVGVVVFF
ncbi:SH3 domain-containing protein [Bowmanella sp. JS7-9]|uniref:SH3 domain-containing protein n=1 Tax=Pseudobowmanella zhangzhouensis TaxID=1537679 RepID=A0ABW1XIW8_9ALTE|nr:SH3 domain-containing protein [Bowmanella sp. JS7-9]